MNILRFMFGIRQGGIKVWILVIVLTIVSSLVIFASMKLGALPESSFDKASCDVAVGMGSSLTDGFFDKETMGGLLDSQNREIQTAKVRKMTLDIGSVLTTYLAPFGAKAQVHKSSNDPLRNIIYQGIPDSRVSIPRQNGAILIIWLMVLFGFVAVYLKRVSATIYSLGPFITWGAISVAFVWYDGHSVSSLSDGIVDSSTYTFVWLPTLANLIMFAIIGSVIAFIGMKILIEMNFLPQVDNDLSLKSILAVFNGKSSEISIRDIHHCPFCGSMAKRNRNCAGCGASLSGINKSFLVGDICRCGKPTLRGLKYQVYHCHNCGAMTNGGEIGEVHPLRDLVDGKITA